MGNRINGHYKRKPFRNDAPLEVDTVKSVLEMQRIYSNLTDREFASMYCYKYRASGLKPSDVLEILDNKRKYDESMLEPGTTK